MEDVEGYRANLRRSTYGIYIYVYILTRQMRGIVMKL